MYFRLKLNHFYSNQVSDQSRVIAFVLYDQVHRRRLLFYISVQPFSSRYSLHQSLSVFLRPFHFTACPFSDPGPWLVGGKLLSRLGFDPDGAQLIIL